MKKTGKEGRKAQDEGERERRRARSERLPEPNQNPWYRAQFTRQESSTEEATGDQTPSVGSMLSRLLRAVPLPPV